MNDEERNDDPIATLIRAAGKRQQASPVAMARVRAAVESEWRDEVGGRRRTRWMIGAAAAAMLILAIVFVPRRSTEVLPTIETTAEAKSIDWKGRTLRLESGTRVVLVSDNVARLERGTLHFASRGGSSVTIATPFGDVHDIGTEFEVRLSTDDVRVRVSEGLVELRGTTAAAGEMLTATRTAVAKAPANLPIRLEGMRLDAVLARVAREKNLTLDWHAPAATRSIVLHGDEPFSPDEALDAATAAAGVTARLTDGRLVIEGKP